MHMPVRRLIKNQRTESCYNNTETKIRQRDMEVASWCVKMEFSLTEK